MQWNRQMIKQETVVEIIGKKTPNMVWLRPKNWRRATTEKSTKTGILIVSKNRKKG